MTDNTDPKLIEEIDAIEKALTEAKRDGNTPTGGPYTPHDEPATPNGGPYTPHQPEPMAEPVSPAGQPAQAAGA